MLTRRELIVSLHMSGSPCHVQVYNTFGVMAQTQRITLVVISHCGVIYSFHMVALTFVIIE